MLLERTSIVCLNIIKVLTNTIDNYPILSSTLSAWQVALPIFLKVFLSVPKVTESKKTKKSVSVSTSFFLSYFWINSPLAGTESAQADPVLAVPPLNTVHCRLYTCAWPTRDEYFQLRTTRDEYFHQPWRPMRLAQKAVWRSVLVCN